MSGVGLFVLGGFADRVGLAGELSGAMAPRGERAPVHDRGVLLTHLCLALAGGGEACSDIEHLRAEPELFGPVGSDSTLWRALNGVGGEELAGQWRRCASGRGPRRPRRGRWWWTSTRRWWRCTRRTRPVLRRISRAGSGSARWCAPPPAASRCGGCCARATRRRTAVIRTGFCAGSGDWSEHGIHGC